MTDSTGSPSPTGENPQADAPAVPEDAVRMPEVTVEFCGEEFVVSPGEPFFIGREGELEIDDNPYLHRRFLQIHDNNSLWWLNNVGSAITATVADEQGSMQAWLAPGAQLPIVFDKTVVWFTAGPTTYEFSIQVRESPFTSVPEPKNDVYGTETIGPMTFTPDQHLLILALCESMLRDGARGAGSIPSSADAAQRLGWKITKFNRKLDNVCEKLTKAGIRGLHGGPEKLAVNRRARLVEYALAARLVNRDELDLLDGLAEAGSVD